MYERSWEWSGEKGESPEGEGIPKAGFHSPSTHLHWSVTLNWKASEVAEAQLRQRVTVRNVARGCTGLGYFLMTQLRKAMAKTRRILLQEHGIRTQRKVTLDKVLHIWGKTGTPSCALEEDSPSRFSAAVLRHFAEREEPQPQQTLSRLERNTPQGQETGAFQSLNKKVSRHGHLFQFHQTCTLGWKDERCSGAETGWAPGLDGGEQEAGLDHPLSAI